MHRAVGVSALVGLLAILAFGTLYGLLGVLIAIPMTAVIQVLLDTIVVNAEPIAEPAGLVGSPWEDLRTRVQALRQQARARLRARTSRMGVDAATADHVVDAVDQQIEVTVARVEQLIAVAEETSEPLAIAAQAVIADKLQRAAEQIEQAVEPVATTMATAAETQGPVRGAEPEAIVNNLSQATERFKVAVDDVGTLVVAAQEESKEARTQQAILPERD
jgi:hypothetical protein